MRMTEAEWRATAKRRAERIAYWADRLEQAANDRDKFPNTEAGLRAFQLYLDSLELQLAAARMEN